VLVEVPLSWPFTITDAPATGSPAALITLPVTLVSCADAISPERDSINKKSSFLIYLLFGFVNLYL
jgi:hypothetical protein